MASVREDLGRGRFYLQELSTRFAGVPANDNCPNSGILRVSTLVAPLSQSLREAPSGKLSGSQAKRRRKTDMTDKDALETVPDASMIALFKSLVGFLTEEAQNRGWDDVSTRLRAVENALAGRTDTSTK